MSFDCCSSSLSTSEVGLKARPQSVSGQSSRNTLPMYWTSPSPSLITPIISVASAIA